MIRYIKAFFLTIFVYFLLLCLFIYLYTNHKISSSQKILERVKITLVNIEPKPKVAPKPKPEPMLEPKPEPEPIPEPEPEPEPEVEEPTPIIENKPIKEIKKEDEILKEEPKVVKKVVKPKPKKKKIIKKPKPKKKKVVKKKKKKIIKKVVKPKKKKIIEKPKKQIITQKTDENIVKKEDTKTTTKVQSKSAVTKIDTNKIRIEQELYFQKIKARIEKNKKYPKVAIRRHMQGVVKVKFRVSKSGKLLGIDILNGKKTFYKSVKKAIQKSFPISIKKGIFKKDFDLTLSIVYKLR